MKIKDYYKEKDYIHYSNCHEDASFLVNQIKNKDTILSIASAIDNSLSMLTANPQKIVAVDYNITQVYLSKLKVTAIKHFDCETYKIFIGILPGDKTKLFNNLKDYLDENTRKYFEKHLYLIDKVGLINCGKFEYYFNVFSKKVLPLVHSKKTIDAFMTAEDIEKQIEIYEKKFNNCRFKLMFKIFFSKFVMKKLGRDKDYFKYNQGSFASKLKKRFEYGIYNNLNKTNPYLQYVIYNEFKTLPYYLKKENYNIIKKNIDKLEIKHLTLKDALMENEKYDFMNLSDVFEYMSSDETSQYADIIHDKLNPNGRVMFWNMINVRNFNNSLKEINISQKNDLAFYYQDVYLYEKVDEDD